MTTAQKIGIGAGAVLVSALPWFFIIWFADGHSVHSAAVAFWVSILISASMFGVFFAADWIKEFSARVKVDDKPVNWGVVLLCLGAFIFVLWAAKFYLGNEVPGSFWERGADYQTEAYVQVFTDTSSSRNYQLKADISKENGNYILQTVHWRNSGTSVFDDCFVKLEEKVSCMDESERTYYIQLSTNQEIK